MRRYFGLAAIAAAFVLLSPATASALGDTCHSSVSVKGEEKTGRRAAMSSAIAAWERAADRKYGRSYANWYYSGDRTIDCKWDSAGICYTCTAKALPCGPSR